MVHEECKPYGRGGVEAQGEGEVCSLWLESQERRVISLPSCYTLCKDVDLTLDR